MSSALLIEFKRAVPMPRFAEVYMFVAQDLRTSAVEFVTVLLGPLLCAIAWSVVMASHNLKHSGLESVWIVVSAASLAHSVIV